MSVINQTRSNRRQSRMIKTNLWRKSHENRYIRYGPSTSCLLNISSTGDNHLKIFAKKFPKRGSKKIFISLFWSLNSCGIFCCENLHFLDSFCYNFFIRFYTIPFKGALRTLLNIYDRAFCKISLNFFSP